MWHVYDTSTCGATCVRNKANLRDLIAATGLVILLKLDSCHRVTFKFDEWSWKTVGHLFFTTSSFVHHFKAIGESNWSYSPETLNSGQNRLFFVPRDLEISQMTLKNYGAPVLFYIKVSASFQSHGWTYTGVTVWKRSIRIKIGDFFVPCDLKIWWMTLKNNRAPLLYHVKHCPSFQSHRWIQTGVTIRKRSIRVKIGDFLSRVTLNIHRWS